MMVWPRWDINYCCAENAFGRPTVCAKPWRKRYMDDEAGTQTQRGFQQSGGLRVVKKVNANYLPWYNVY
uniref:Uncharacterized protein n=1 Tax=Hyaloperonospora arabidopsidis (strain Emoy2) TaxID=559515 RepID=M4BG73_HYAAE